MMHVHDLAGCAPVPLAHYLKALGILRLVSEQADPEARGWWHGELFRLMTRLSRAELEEFFLERYEPTPLVSPWNKGSGFFQDADPVLAALEGSPAPRFLRFREGLRAARAMLAQLAQADERVRTIKAESKRRDLTAGERQALKKSPEYKQRLAEAERSFKRFKAELIPQIRLAWRGPHREWMDAAIVLGDGGRPQFPALLGTGGNDGRLDFTYNFMRRVGDVFDLASAAGAPTAHAARWLRGALEAEAVTECGAGAVGQFLPGMAGGANSGNGPAGDATVNPMDFVLMMEGTLLFSAAATRRLGVSEVARAAAPFAVSAHGAGYSTAAASDEGARGEQWMPLWRQPLGITELRQLLGEGRAQLRRAAARHPVDLARAAVRLGTARGLSAFERYGYIERNGQSNLAVPLGRFPVTDGCATATACLDDLDGWLHRLRSVARPATNEQRRRVPARLRDAERRLADALLSVVQHSDEPLRWQSVLGAIADVEAVLVTGTGFRAGPAPRLRPEWVQAADDGSPEIRLALACALQAGSFSRRAGWPVDPVRHHWLPLKQGRFATTGTAAQSRLLDDPRVVLQGRSGLADAAALVERRLVEASQRGTRSLGLVPGRRAAARPSDLATLLAGRVDLDRTMRLARALMALDGRAWAASPVRLTAPPDDSVPEPAWMALRLALLPWSPAEGAAPAADPAIVRRLTAGDGASAVELALRRLRGAGIRAVLRGAAAAPETARLWAAALAFPINLATSRSFLRCLDPKEMPAS